MKRLLFLSLLMIQGLWGADAQEEPQEGTQYILKFTQGGKDTLYKFGGIFRTLNLAIEAVPDNEDPIRVDMHRNTYDLALMVVNEINNNKFLTPGFVNQHLVHIINDSEELFRLTLAINYLDPKIDGLEEGVDPLRLVIKALYIAWLNQDTNRLPIVELDGQEAFKAMGIKIERVPEEWGQLSIDLSDCFDSVLRAHIPGSILYLRRFNKMPAVRDGRLNLSRQHLTVRDAWNIPNPDDVIKLDIECNELTNIASGTFVGLSNLQSLYLYGNRLTTLDPGAFRGLSSLKILSLDSNKLRALAPRIFAELSNLSSLNLYGNQLTTIASGAFDGLINLEGLSLSRNQLTTLAPGTFAGLSNLKYLNLDFNKLTELARDIFAELSNLKYLNLRSNQLTALALGIFDGLIHLQHLDLYSNKLRALAPGVFAELINLEWFDLHDNPELVPNIDNYNTNRLNSIKRRYPGWFKNLDLLPALSGKDFLKKWHPGLFKKKDANFLKDLAVEAACAIQ